jgi:hypothetical protein
LYQSKTPLSKVCGVKMGTRRLTFFRTNFGKLIKLEKTGIFHLTMNESIDSKITNDSLPISLNYFEKYEI